MAPTVVLYGTFHTITLVNLFPTVLIIILYVGQKNCMVPYNTIYLAIEREFHAPHTSLHNASNTSTTATRPKISSTIQ